MADDSSAASSDNEEQQMPTTIADDIVVTKYKMAAEITNRKFLLAWTNHLINSSA